jgi:hypothetical protein
LSGFCTQLAKLRLKKGQKILAKWGRLTRFSCTLFLVDQPDPIRERVKMLEQKKMPLVIGCLNCNFRTEDENEMKMFDLNGCPNCPKEIEIRSLFVECREWFDKVNGNSYFSARIWINGGQVAILPFQYGYGDQFLYEAQKKLLELGYLPQENKNNSLFTISELMGFDFYSAKTSTKQKEMFKHYANYQERKAGN